MHKQRQKYTEQKDILLKQIRKHALEGTQICRAVQSRHVIIHQPVALAEVIEQRVTHIGWCGALYLLQNVNRAKEAAVCPGVFKVK